MRDDRTYVDGLIAGVELGVLLGAGASLLLGLLRRRPAGGGVALAG